MGTRSLSSSSSLLLVQGSRGWHHTAEQAKASAVQGLLDSRQPLQNPRPCAAVPATPLRQTGPHKKTTGFCGRLMPLEGETHLRIAHHYCERCFPYFQRAPQLEKLLAASATASSRGESSKNTSYPLWLHRRATRALGLGVLSSRERVLSPRVPRWPLTVWPEELHSKSRFSQHLQAGQH